MKKFFNKEDIIDTLEILFLVIPVALLTFINIIGLYWLFNPIHHQKLFKTIEYINSIIN